MDPKVNYSIDCIFKTAVYWFVIAFEMMQLCWMIFFSFFFWFEWLYFILIFSVLFFASEGMRFADYTSNFDDLKIRVVAENNFSRLITGTYTSASR